MRGWAVGSGAPSSSTTAASGVATPSRPPSRSATSVGATDHSLPPPSSWRGRSASDASSGIRPIVAGRTWIALGYGMNEASSRDRAAPAHPTAGRSRVGPGRGSGSTCPGHFARRRRSCRGVAAAAPAWTARTPLAVQARDDRPDDASSRAIVPARGSAQCRAASLGQLVSRHGPPVRRSDQREVGRRGAHGAVSSIRRNARRWHRRGHATSGEVGADAQADAVDVVGAAPPIVRGRSPARSAGPVADGRNRSWARSHRRLVAPDRSRRAAVEVRDGHAHPDPGAIVWDRCRWSP